MDNNYTFANREALKSRINYGLNDTFSNKVALDTILTGPPLESTLQRLLTATQAAFLTGKTFSTDEYFNPVQDFYSQWFIALNEISDLYPWIEDQPTGYPAKKCYLCPGGIPPEYIEPFYRLGDNDTFSNDSAMNSSAPSVAEFCFDEN
jgi:hypothetical protein